MPSIWTAVFWLPRVDATTSVFKGGSTVPVKFQLRDANGNLVQANSAPVWVTPVKGSPTTAAVDEGIYTDVVDTATVFRWSSSDQQYIYNWGSPKTGAGFYWRIGVSLDDGKTYTVNIALR